MRWPSGAKVVAFLVNRPSWLAMPVSAVDVHAFARLKNGNTMIVESSVGRVIEVDQAGKLAHH